MKWTFALDNSIGSNGESGEWWIVTDGETEFQSFDEADAEWLCDFLNVNDA